MTLGDRNQNSVDPWCSREGGGVKWSFYSCLYAAPLKYRLCNWRAAYPAKDISTVLNVCARTRALYRRTRSNTLAEDFQPCQMYARSVFSRHKYSFFYEKEKMILDFCFLRTYFFHAFSLSKANVPMWNFILRIKFERSATSRSKIQASMRYVI